MQKLFTANQIKKIDEQAIKKYRIPATVLMENAATNITNQIIKYFNEKNISYSNRHFALDAVSPVKTPLMASLLKHQPKIAEQVRNDGSTVVRKIAIFCGTGNNGGDGLVVARQLSTDFEITVFMIGDLEKMTPETQTNFKIANSIAQIKIIKIENIETVKKLKLNFDCIIDAMIGVGFEGSLRPLISEIVKKINYTKSLKIAIDVPTGFNSDRGLEISKSEIQNILKPDLTVAILGAKIGMYNNFKTNICGEIRVANLAIGGTIADRNCNNYLLEKCDIEHFIEKRNSNTNKFDYGKVVIIAGSETMPGAASLTANAAIRAGAGNVFLFSPKIHPSISPHIIAETVSKTSDGTIHPENFDYLNSKCQKADAIIFGPGIGQNSETLSMIRKLIFANLNQKIVVDADALSVLNSEDILNENVVLTPHLGEFVRIVSGDQNPSRIIRGKIEKKKFEFLEQIVTKMNCTILLKGSTTVIYNGQDFYWNIFGNAGMATAGSGDVLAGIIAAILVKPNVKYLNSGKNTSTVTLKKFTQRVAIASLIHSLSGDFYAENFGEETLSASDLIDCMKFVLK